MKKTLLPIMLISMMTSSLATHADDLSTTPQDPNASTVQGSATNSELNAETTYFISLNGLRIRSTPSDSGKTVGLLTLNDTVKVVNPTVILNGKYVEITLVQTVDQIPASAQYFINKEYLSVTFIDYKEFTGKYFIVVNVATEMLRLYERNCSESSCHNKMIMETEVVVGEDKDHPKEEKGKGRSVLGSYRVTGWTKFYQDSEGHYPSWYKDGYPDLPPPNSGWSEWFSSKVMPKDIKGDRIGKMRGAFGWFTAFVEPQPFGQWTHGTIGWGADKDTLIKKTKMPLINVVSDPRSSGCTRNNNEAIAFLRQIVDIGAPIIKIYAIERIMDSWNNNHPTAAKSWDYVLTKNRDYKMDRASVLASLNITNDELDSYWNAKLYGGELIFNPNSPLTQVLEVGTYQYDNHPDVIPYTPGENLKRFKRKIGQKGNVYGVKSTAMHGTFYIDTGLLEGYAHPDEILEVSGFADEVTPPWMAIQNF